MKGKKEDIASYTLNPSFHQVHKTGTVKSEFGLDNTTELIHDGFGLYSSSGLKMKIGPIKSEFFRLGLGKKGSVHLNCGLESYFFQPNSMVFTFPGQVFSLHDRSDDFDAYYMFFTEGFIEDALSLKNLREQYPFFNYAGMQHIPLNEQEAADIEQLILRINHEIKNRKSDIKQAIQLYIQLILMEAKRSYMRQQLGSKETGSMDNVLLRNYKRLVSQHFIFKRNVSDYAQLLNISPDHLSKTIRSQTGKTAHQFIDEMLLLESKALLLHTDLTVTEVAYRLEFTDPSYFNKFFRKLTSVTPLQYRSKI